MRSFCLFWAKCADISFHGGAVKRKVVRGQGAVVRRRKDEILRV